MCHNGYKFADLKSCCPDSLSKWEKSIHSKSGKDVILIAYEKE